MFTRTLLTKFILAIFSSFISYSTSARHFVQNVGQVKDQHLTPRTDIDFKLSAANGLNIFIDAGKIYYQFAKQGSDSTIIDMYRMDVELLGANPSPKIITDGKAAHYERYYTNGLDGAIAQKFSKITYLDVYPGIDLLFYFTKDGQLEYDFVVGPKGKISDIKIKYSGVEEVKINADGSLTARTPFGSVTENAPYAYQQEDKKRVAAAFMVENNIVSFSAADYIGTLVIDPVLEWATYFGGSEYDAIMDIAKGIDGMLYAVGNTNSLSNIATTGAFQIAYGGGSNPVGADAFLAKYDPLGNLIWTTYYGGNNVDQGSGIATDTIGNIYIAGRTNSAQSIATAGVHQETKAGTSAGYDAYIAKFDTSGARVWGTYYGGTGAEGAQNIVMTTDHYNNIYLAGNTASTTGIATSGTHQQNRSGTSDGFLAKFSTNGLLEWGTYVGGTSVDVINGITTDTAGNIYVIGNTTSIDGISTTGTHQLNNAGGTDAFVIKFSPVGIREWGTYIGGAAYEEGTGIVADSFGSIYITGSTESTAGISTTNAHQPFNSGGINDMFFGKIDAQTGTMNWGTYYGGSGNDFMAKPILGSSGTVILTGTSTSTNNITTPDAIMPNHTGDGKLVVAIFDTNGVRQWGTYLGGNLSELNTSGILTLENELWLSGYTNSSNGLSTPGANQPVFGGNHDGYLLKVNLCFAPQRPNTVIGELQICANTIYTYRIDQVTGADAYLWIIPNGWTGISDSISIDLQATHSGKVQVVAINDCGLSDTSSIDMTVLPAPEPLILRTANVLTANQTYASYLWNKDGQPIQGAILPTLSVNLNGSYSLTVTSDNGCTGTSDAIEVTNLSIPEPKYPTVQLYPNPAHESVIIKVKYVAEMELFDQAGRTLHSVKLGKGENSISLKDLKSGLYTVRISTGNDKVEYSKLIIVN